jgi:IS4 transposase
MTGTEIVRSFEEQRPVCVMAQMALERLLSPEEVDKLFHEVAQGQYERQLLFSSLARLMAGVVLCREQSVHAAYKKMQDQIGVSLNAVYTKLERVELGLSQALVRHSYAQLKGVSKGLRAVEASPVAGYHAKILDGNHLAATEHRLLETRRSTAAPLPGKALVVLDPCREAIADLFPIEDGHAQERSCLDQVLETVRRDDLWIADRNFCTLKFLYTIALRGAGFVVRWHDQLHGQRLGRRRLVGKTSTGRVYESPLRLPPYEHHALTVRCIEIELFHPTRDGDRAIAILTNLEEEEADAVQVAEIYRGRWRIETAFQKLTTTLQCEINTLCYPKAALFAFSLACVAYNAISLVLAAIRVEQGAEQTERLSFHYLSSEIAQAYDGMMIALPPAHWEQLRRFPAADFTQRLRQVARCIDLAYYRKSKRSPKKPKPKIRHHRANVHVSTSQLLNQRKQETAC